MLVKGATEQHLIQHGIVKWWPKITLKISCQVLLNSHSLVVGCICWIRQEQNGSDSIMHRIILMVSQTGSGNPVTDYKRMNTIKKLIHQSLRQAIKIGFLDRLNDKPKLTPDYPWWPMDSLCRWNAIIDMLGSLFFRRHFQHRGSGC